MTFRLTGAKWVTLATVITMSALSLPGAALGASAGPSIVPGGQITLELQTVNGSGCPAGSAWATMQPDNTGFRINYTSFIAQDGGSASATDIRKNCQVNLLVHIPQGFTFAIASADYWGRAHLETGAVALVRSNYYFQGSSDNNYYDHPYHGPLNGSWRATDITATADLVYAPCGAVRSLNINSELRVDAGTSTKTNYISMRASDGDVYTLVNFQWKQC
jgi:hypothetical protein